MLKAPPHRLARPNADLLLISDYINPIDLCNRLNTYIVPEAAVHAFITILFLVNGYWIALILNLPMLAWNAKKSVPIHSLLSKTYADKTQDFRKPTPPGRDRDFQKAQRPQEGKLLRRLSTRPAGSWQQSQESFIKLGFHLVMFFFYLYSMIVALIRDESH
jgi:hypothetical protein